MLSFIVTNFSFIINNFPVSKSKLFTFSSIFVFASFNSSLISIALSWNSSNFVSKCWLYSTIFPLVYSLQRSTELSTNAKNCLNILSIFVFRSLDSCFKLSFSYLNLENSFLFSKIYSAIFLY